MQILWQTFRLFLLITRRKRNSFGHAFRLKNPKVCEHSERTRKSFALGNYFDSYSLHLCCEHRSWEWNWKRETLEFWRHLEECNKLLRRKRKEVSQLPYLNINEKIFCVFYSFPSCVSKRFTNIERDLNDRQTQEN